MNTNHSQSSGKTRPIHSFVLASLMHVNLVLNIYRCQAPHALPRLEVDQADAHAASKKLVFSWHMWKFILPGNGDGAKEV